MRKEIHYFPSGTRLAFDVNISDREIGQYARLGAIVVCVALEGEPDERWVDRAYERGAEIILSHDLDIPNILDKEDYDMKWMEPT